MTGIDLYPCFGSEHPNLHLQHSYYIDTESVSHDLCAGEMAILTISVS